MQLRVVRAMDMFIVLGPSRQNRQMQSPRLSVDYRLPCKGTQQSHLCLCRCCLIMIWTQNCAGLQKAVLHEGSSACDDFMTGFKCPLPAWEPQADLPANKRSTVQERGTAHLRSAFGMLKHFGGDAADLIRLPRLTFFQGFPMRHGHTRFCTARSESQRYAPLRDDPPSCKGHYFRQGCLLQC